MVGFDLNPSRPLIFFLNNFSKYMILGKSAKVFQSICFPLFFIKPGIQNINEIREIHRPIAFHDNLKIFPTLDNQKKHVV